MFALGMPFTIDSKNSPLTEYLVCARHRVYLTQPSYLGIIISSFNKILFFAQFKNQNIIKRNIKKSCSHPVRIHLIISHPNDNHLYWFLVYSFRVRLCKYFIYSLSYTKATPQGFSSIKYVLEIFSYQQLEILFLCSFIAIQQYFII